MSFTTEDGLFAHGRMNVSAAAMKAAAKILADPSAVTQDTPITLQRLGFTDAAIASMTGGPGLVLISGSTGSGKTTIAQALSAHYREVSGRDPVLHVTQKGSEIGEAETIGNMWQALRPEHSAILVGDLRDAGDVRSAMKAALAGHRVISITHAPSAVQAIRRLMAQFPEGERQEISQLLFPALRSVVHQNLHHQGGGVFRVTREFLDIEDELRDRLKGDADWVGILQNWMGDVDLDEEAAGLVREGFYHQVIRHRASGRKVVTESFLSKPVRAGADKANGLARQAVADALRVHSAGKFSGMSMSQPVEEIVSRLADALKTFPCETHTQRLELVARAFGFRSWHAAQGRG